MGGDNFWILWRGTAVMKGDIELMGGPPPTRKNPGDIMQNLFVPFIFQEECRMKIEHILLPSVFSKLGIRVSEGHVHYVHTIRFSEPTKIGSVKMDRVNGLS